MPWGIRGGYLINLDTGARKNKKPMPHDRLVRYQRALYANVPEARRVPRHRSHAARRGYSDSLHPRDSRGRWRFKAYNPNQRRVPKGNPKGGQWTSTLPSGGRVLRALRFGRPNINDYGELYDPLGTNVPPYEPWSKKAHRIRRGAQEGARAIDSVLTFPKGLLKSLDKRGLVAVLHGREMNPYGQYVSDKNRLTMGERNPSPIETFVHEFGHLLDRQVLGRGSKNWIGEQATGTDALHTDALKVWWRAVHESPAYHQLGHQAEWSVHSIISTRTGKKIASSPLYADYLHKRSELFARSFTQYIALKSKSPSLLGHINRSLKRVDYPIYWRWTTFGGIANALDRIMAENHLLLPPGTKEFQNRLRSMQGRWLKRLRKGRPLRLKMWVPSQKRDWMGRWTSGGFGARPVAPITPTRHAYHVLSRAHAHHAKTYHGILRRLSGPTRMGVRVAQHALELKMNPPTLLDVVEGGVDELYLRKRNRRMRRKEYNPRQQRYPKGTPQGGQWKPLAAWARSKIKSPRDILIPRQKPIRKLIGGAVGSLAAFIGLRLGLQFPQAAVQFRNLWKQAASEGMKTSSQKLDWITNYLGPRMKAPMSRNEVLWAMRYAAASAKPRYPLLGAGFKAYNPSQPRAPRGTPIGGEWIRSLTNPTYRAALRVSDEVGNTVPITVHRRVLANGQPVGGAYISSHIYVSERYDRPYMNTAHEIGHALDHQALGEHWASSHGGELNGVRKALNNSQKVKELRAWNAMGAVFYQGRRIPISPQTTHHLLKDKELFARAYEQHYARHSRHGAARKELRLAQSHPLSYYWNDKDFSRIDSELSRVLKRHGYR